MSTTSATPDPVHEQFWSKKLTLPVNDPFWGHHHPGERWGCKCTCEQTDNPVNDLGLSQAPKDTASKGLKGNPGETGELFSEDHPYFPKNCGGCPFNNGLKNRFKGLFNKEKDCSSCMAVANGIAKANSSFDIGESLVKLYSLDNRKLLSEIRKITSSRVFKPIEKNVFSAINDSDKDFERLLDVSRKATNRGYKSYILPNPGRGRTPDIILERKSIFKVYDVKTIIGKNSAGSRLKESIGQTKRVLLHITTDYDARKLAKEIKKYFEINPEALEVLIYKGKKEVSVNKNMIQQSNFINTFMRLYVK